MRKRDGPTKPRGCAGPRWSGDYDRDADLTRITTILTAFGRAAECQPMPVGGCIKSVDTIMNAINADPQMQAAGLAVERDPQVVVFNQSPMRKCKLQWFGNYNNLGTTNTQTNVGLPLTAVGTPAFDGLFSGYDNPTSGWRVAQRAYARAISLMDNRQDIVPGFIGQIGDARVRGMFALFFYIVNANTYSDLYRTQLGNGWHGYESKNVRDVFLKTPPATIVLDLRNQVPNLDTFLDGLANLVPGVRQVLNSNICVAIDQHDAFLTCIAHVNHLLELLSDPAIDPHSQLLGAIPHEIDVLPYRNRDIIVVEARGRNNPINQDGTFVVTGGVAGQGNVTFGLPNVGQMRARLQPMACH